MCIGGWRRSSSIEPKSPKTPGSIYVPPDTITLCTYSLDTESAAVIRDASDRLYGWLEPDLPQDLCFLRGTEPWLVNNAVDDFACLIITREEAASLRTTIPGLVLREVPSSDIHRH